MIEINLIPDVKLELLRARRQRTSVISISIFIAIVALGLVGLLGFYTFGVQSIAQGIAQNGIKDESKKLQQVEDLSKTLTIQQQLDELDKQHNEKNMTSRVLDFMTTAVPTDENRIAISQLSLDSEENTITIEGQATNGYEALEVFKKTLAETKFAYREDGKQQKTIGIADSITDGKRSYGEDSNGQRVLRFTLSFSYPDELFSPQAESGRIIAPTKQNATDSVLGIPKSLFTEKSNEGGAQ